MSETPNIKQAEEQFNLTFYMLLDMQTGFDSGLLHAKPDTSELQGKTDIAKMELEDYLKAYDRIIEITNECESIVKKFSDGRKRLSESESMIMYFVKNHQLATQNTMHLLREAMELYDLRVGDQQTTAQKCEFIYEKFKDLTPILIMWRNRIFGATKFSSCLDMKLESLINKSGNYGNFYG